MFLEVRNLRKDFGGFSAVAGVSFDVGEREIVGLLGPNGSGKSTTLALISGTLAPSAGSIRLRGREIAGQRAHQACRAGVGRTFQIPRPFRSLSVQDNVEVAARRGGAVREPQHLIDQRCKEALQLTHLWAMRGDSPTRLGAANLKRLEMARALATGPSLLLADESLGGLAPGEIDDAAAMLMRIRDERGISIVWVEHILSVLLGSVDRIVVLDRGSKIFDGEPSRAIQDAEVRRVYLGEGAEVPA